MSLEAIDALTAGKAAGEAGALLGVGAGLGLWNYNRNYFKYDQKMHWSRFCFVKNMAIAQQGQYREDIEDLAQQTSNRMDLYQITAIMGITIITALFCPGRVGLHTPPPPSWLMGLEFLNVGAVYMWLMLTMWLAMHASLRADSAAAHMLTRIVRLPVPSQRALDRARKFLYQYEKMPLNEMFRLPLMQHGVGARGVPKPDGKFDERDEDDRDYDAETRQRREWDVPYWYRKERGMDESMAVECMMPRDARNANCPEHFEVMRVMQQEWWPYDIYARISMFLAQMHLCHAWAYFQMGHTIQETRALWACLCVLIPLFVTQHILLTLDIVTPKNELPLQRIGPFGIVTGFIACVLEYKRWYSQEGIYISAVLVFLTYFIHIGYTLQLYRLCTPDWGKAPEAADVPGAAWWPGHWCLPQAWVHAVWLVAPPKEKCVGENDLVGELRNSSEGRRVKGALGGNVFSTPEEDRRNDVHRALGKHGESPAWRVVKIGLIALVIGWLWLTLGYLIDLVNEGTKHPSLLSAPGLPNQLRDPRYRPAKPGYPKPQEVGIGGYEFGPASEELEFRVGEHGGRRLHRGAAEPHHVSRAELAEKVRRVLPLLERLVARPHDRTHVFAQRAAETPSTPAVSSTGTLLPPAPPRASVQWPALFQPRLMACRPGDHDGKHMVATLSSYGRGAAVSSMHASPLTEVADGFEQPAETTTFSLDGIAALGPLMASSWGHHGLLVTTVNGAVVECPGQGPDATGRWACRPLGGAHLPLGPNGGAVAVARHHSAAAAAGEPPALRAAVAYPGESSITIFTRAAGHGMPWLPAGEARTAALVTAAAFHHEDETLLMGLADGSVTQLHLKDGSISEVASAFAGPAHTWQAACGLPGGRVARLGMRPAVGGEAPWEPTLLLGA